MARIEQTLETISNIATTIILTGMSLGGIGALIGLCVLLNRMAGL